MRARISGGNPRGSIAAASSGVSARRSCGGRGLRAGMTADILGTLELSFKVDTFRRGAVLRIFADELSTSISNAFVALADCVNIALGGRAYTRLELAGPTMSLDALVRGGGESRRGGRHGA